MEIKLPDGFNKPEGVKDEQPFTVSATVYIKGDKLCIEQVDGYDVGKKKPKGEGAFMDVYNSNMGEQ
jgi:hypothetical protein